MSDRTTETYNAVFQYIEQNLLELKPDSFMTDFEPGLRLSINQSYPNAKLYGCWFHFKQAIRKYCNRRPKLRYLLKTNQNASVIYQQLMNLPLLPEENFKAGYDSIIQKAKQCRLFRALFVLLKYFSSYWLAQNRRNSLSVSGLNMRTTSSLESFNSVINRTVTQHANIFKFMDGIKLIDFAKNLELVELSKDSARQPTTRKRLADQKREERIQNTTERLHRSQITPSEFLDFLSGGISVEEEGGRKHSRGRRGGKKRSNQSSGDSPPKKRGRRSGKKRSNRSSGGVPPKKRNKH